MESLHSEVSFHLTSLVLYRLQGLTFSKGHLEDVGEGREVEIIDCHLALPKFTSGAQFPPSLCAPFFMARSFCVCVCAPPLHPK